MKQLSTRGTGASFISALNKTVCDMNPAPIQMSGLMTLEGKKAYFFSQHHRTHPSDKPITLVHLELQFDPVQTEAAE